MTCSACRPSTSTTASASTATGPWQEMAVIGVLDALLPVLDDIHAARQHGDLTDGPFAAIADKLETR